MNRMEGKVAIVTGAAMGIGLATAELFVKEGATVVMTDMLPEGAEAAKKLGNKASFFQHDVTSESTWQEVISKTVKTHGKLDVLVNNAGICTYATIEDLTHDDWTKLMKVNGDGVYLGCKYGVKAIREGQRGGSIINLSSLVGLRANASLAGYAASKGAVRMLTKAVALHAGQFNIRCNSVHPGPVHTRQLDRFISAFPPDQVNVATAALGENIPMRRVGTTADISNAILFLASDESTWITGAEICVDGGTSL